MLSTSLIQEIDRLLKKGDLSQRQIAEHLGVGRTTVALIARGDRGLHGKECRDRPSPTTATSPPRRCPCCGYRVYLPCLVCRTRRTARRSGFLA